MTIEIKDKTLSVALIDFEKELIAKQEVLEKVTGDWQLAQEGVQELQQLEMGLHTEIAKINEYIDYIKQIIGTK